MWGSGGGLSLFSPVASRTGRWLPSTRTRRTKGTIGFLLFVNLVIYSCASHKVKHPFPLSGLIFLFVRGGEYGCWVFWFLLSVTRKVYIDSHTNAFIHNSHTSPSLLNILLMYELLPCSAHSPVVFVCRSVWPIKDKGTRKPWKRTYPTTPWPLWLLGSVIIYKIIQLDVSGSSSGIVSSVISRAQHIRTFVTPIELNNLNGPSCGPLLFLNFLSDPRYGGLPRGTVPAQMLAGFLISFSLSEPVTFERGKQDRK